MPDLDQTKIFNELGICNACLSFERNKKSIGIKRKKEFEKIINNAKSSKSR